MASSSYKSRPEYLQAPKFYGYKTISVEEEKKLVERLSKPTISIIQAQLASLSNRSHHQTLDIQNPKFNIESNSVNPIEYYDGETLTSRGISSPPSSPSLSPSNCSSRLIDLRSIDDYENVSDRLNKLAEIWNRTGKTNPLLPPCACARGELLLKEDNENWMMNIHCHCSSACSSVHNRYTSIQEPVEWNRINKIVRRLHSSGTAGSIARQKESQALLSALSKRHIDHSTNYFTENINMQKFTNPESRSSLFDQRGHFKPIKYINQWETFQKLNHKLNRITRPTTSSKLKRRGVCVLCDQNLSLKTPLGVVNNYSIDKTLHKTFHLCDKKQENDLVERVIRPTFASQANKCQCPKSYLFNPHIKQNSDHIQLSGESIIQRLKHFNKQLPLISGLTRSSSINSITNRLYSGKCRRTNCSYR
ncbi:unnamed protein product [Schistosoma mattheei]|uniref:Uncharacterized protein n=1 Tax=Schistosoma mattheei TaxID=31246 RepID=A0A183NWK6_9TREM|nr:unnamed protein product [Schistosoma mattheei]VDP34148.1 unnamed protein product [Schistosoma mattheei]